MWTLFTHLLSPMVSSFFKKSIQLSMITLSGKMVLTMASFTRTVNLTLALFWFVSYTLKKLFIRNKLSGNDGHILILDVDIDDEYFILIKLYNANTQPEQLKTLSKLMEMLRNLHLTQSNNIIFVRDFDFLFNVKFENYRGNTVFKKTFCRKNIWTERNIQFDRNFENKRPWTKAIYFSAKYMSAFFQRPLDYFFISYNIQEFILETDIIPAVLTSFSREKQNS